MSRSQFQPSIYSEVVFNILFRNEHKIFSQFVVGRLDLLGYITTVSQNIL